MTTANVLAPGTSPVFDRFVDKVDDVVATGDGEDAVTRAVASMLEELLEGTDFVLPESVTAAHSDHYVMYPLYVHPSGSFSIASAVWNVGQSTPVHGHETWGVVGIYSGGEHERRYVKPTRADEPLVPAGEQVWSPGQVTVCCTTDDDVHEVSCAGDAPCVGIHVYGADIGTLRRRAYDPETGAVRWFVSSWATPGA